MQIVDRRLNPGGKSLANRQRFLRRAKAMVQRAVRDSAIERDIQDLEAGGEVSIPLDGIGEPSFRRAPTGGDRDYILPGNKTYVEGDTIERPDGQGGGTGAGTDGGGEDAFRFVLTPDEFLELFLDDLELPDLAKRRVTTLETQGLRRAGYSVTGSPANLALGRTMRNALARRLALRRPSADDVRALQERIEALRQEGADPERLKALFEELEALERHRSRVPYIDPLDIRFRRFEAEPKATAQAVMFCLMDVSGSMTEHMKDLAKRFFMLLHVFLTRRYRHVEIVFIRHTHEAREVDQETFFRSTETGGTLVSSALVEMKRIVEERFSPSDWNIYAAQASDGDNDSGDSARTGALLREAILPVCQHFAYLEVRNEGGPSAGFLPRETTLWRTYAALRSEGCELAMRKVGHRREIFPVFRDLFQKRDAGAEVRR
ncbi:MAG TPA: YeaH/YhbH family protein [Microvirga sp.]|nr:YeaH/YhbH family protein [Microvirga sp.]